MLEPCDGKLSRTVLRGGKGAARLLPYPVLVESKKSYWQNVCNFVHFKYMDTEKPIYRVGTSLKDLLSFPREVKRVAGYQLHRLQNGLDPENWKPFQVAA
jgi:hypothetical protein